MLDLTKILENVDFSRITMEMMQRRHSPTQWEEGRAKDITFIVTKDCQLACHYCYQVGKNSHERMSLETAKEAVDFLLNDKSMVEEFPSAVFDFIGGEPLLEIDLIDQTCDYLKTEMFRRDHPWFNSYRITMSTNGINYHEPKVQRFIEKNHEHLDIGISIDGTRQKHDANRIYKNSGKGSYDDVVRNIPLWVSQFPDCGTKVTVSHADLPYIKESVMHLFSLGIHTVNINCVFENVWRDGDDDLFENQLMQLADSIIEGGYYDGYECSFFNEWIGHPLPHSDNQNWCGTGKMLAIDAAGNLYPCLRFSKFSLRNKSAWVLGTIRDGINPEKLAPFLKLDRLSQSTQECIDCDVASGCAWCQAENYDCSPDGSLFHRSTAICKMHKARVRANQYYWGKLHGLNKPIRQDPSNRVGRVTHDECEKIRLLNERRNGLEELALILTADDHELYDKMVHDTTETSSQYQQWWDDMSAKYQWKGSEDASWEIQFDTGEIFLNEK